jgi:hypothetical protein
LIRLARGVRQPDRAATLLASTARYIVPLQIFAVASVRRQLAGGFGGYGSGGGA